jgi:DNA-directed RNA polymerase specialized sigma subunit
MARKTRQFQLSKEQQKLAADNINLARREAWKLQRTTDIDYDTLEGAALEGLCKAAYRYDPESGFKFSSLAVPTIRGELLHWIRDRTYAMRLTHRMRETWIKGRKLLYRGTPDDEIAKTLSIEASEWQEIKSVCSGPPLELSDQAKPTESLEPEEIDFAAIYIEDAERVWLALDRQYQIAIESYLTGSTNRLPSTALREYLSIYEKLK